MYLLFSVYKQHLTAARGLRVSGVSVLARHQRVEQRPDVAVIIGKATPAGSRRRSAARGRHQHVGVADIAVGGDARGMSMSPSSGKAAESSLCPLMLRKCTLEDLAALAEPADRLEDLAAWIVEHLGESPLAEIEPVIGVVANRLSPSTVPSTRVTSR